MNKIFLTGAKPAMVYGAAVLGMTDSELRRVRGLMIAPMTPEGNGMPFDLKLPLVGDPCWREALAPALMWAAEIWRYSNPTSPAPSDLRRMTRWWADVLADAANVSWRSSKGPIMRARLSLERIGWSFTSPFTWTDDSGDVLMLARISPQLLLRLLRDATARHHERAASERFHTGGAVSFDVARAFITSEASKAGYRERYLAKAAACQALWTNDKFKARGFASDGMCSQCGMPDSVFHRIWECQSPEVLTARNRIADAQLIEQAMLSDRSFPWTTGLFSLPTELPKPSASDGLVFCDAGGNVVDFPTWAALVWDTPFTIPEIVADGSAFPHEIKLLARAGWAVACLGREDKQIRAYLLGAVPAHLPQTSQAAEFYAISAVQMISQHRVFGFSDCKNVVNAANRPWHIRMLSSSCYSGLHRAAYRKGASRIDHEFAYTPAHRSDAAIRALPPRERRIAWGNQAVDLLAKRAATELHTPVPSEVASNLRCLVDRARVVLRLVAGIFPLYPRQRHDKAPIPDASAHVSADEVTPP